MESGRHKTKAKPKPQTKPNNNKTRMHLEGEISPPGCPDMSKHNIAKSAFFVLSGPCPKDHSPSLLFFSPRGHFLCEAISFHVLCWQAFTFIPEVHSVHSTFSEAHFIRILH